MLFCLLGAVLAPHQAGAQVNTSILPSDNTTTWVPGMMAVGGIPIRTTVYTTLNASTYGNGATDASAAIQAALDACPSGQVVMLSAGTFTVNNFILIHSSITLRGAGAKVTILQKTNGAKPRTSPMVPVDPSTYTYDAQPVIILGPGRWPGPDSTTSQNLSVDGAKGATAVTVASAAGFAAGQYVLLDELSGASWQNTPPGFPGAAQVWQGDRVSWNMHLPVQQYQDDCANSDATGPYDTTPGTPPAAMSWFSRTDRPTCEIKEVASVAGNVVNFTTPLHISYRVSHTAQLTRYTATGNGGNGGVQVKNAGVENLTVLGGADGQIRFECAAYSWAKGIENTQWIGEGFAVDNSFRVEIRDSYIHDASWPQPGGAGYAISFADGSSEILVEDNVSINACKTMVARSCGAGSVFGYNYADDAWDQDDPTWVEVHLNASHMAGPHHVLFEGNEAPNIDSDYTHGNAIYLTFLRNYLTGQRRDFTDSSNIRAIGLAYGSWWDSFVGNVSGRSGMMAGWIYNDAAMAGNNANWTDHDIWKIGYDPERWGMDADPNTLSTLIRGGNYDYLTNTTHWENLTAQAIPNSFYLTSKPCWFGNIPWPPIGPDVPGIANDIPAKHCYDLGLMPNCLTCASTTPTSSPTQTPSNTATATPTMTASNTPTASSTMSFTLSPTASATSTPTSTATLTPTNSPTLTPTSTASPTATNTLPPGTFTPTPQPTETATGTPSVTASRTPTSSPTSSPTSTATWTTTRTATSTTSSTSTSTASSTATATPTLTASRTSTRTATATPSSTPTATASFTPTTTPTPTPSFTSTPKPIPTFTPSLTDTPSPSVTAAPTPAPLVLYPNPVQGPGMVTVEFDLPESLGQVEIKIFTTSFRLVKRTIVERPSAGVNRAELDLVDDSGAPLANGLYYVVVTANWHSTVGKLLVLR